MITRQQVLDDVDLRYRNTFTTAQKLVWVNDGEREIFEIFEIDSEPYNFTTVTDTFFYPIPSEVDIEKIKTISIQVDDGKPANYDELPFKRNDDSSYANESEYWYTIVQNNFYINVPGGAVNKRNVYVFNDCKPTEWNTSNLMSYPSTPARFLPILKLYLLEQIAAARKDVVMKNNYASDRQELIQELEWKMKMSEPDFISPADVNPKASRGFGRNWEKWFRGR